MIYSTSGSSAGIGFAVPVNTARRVVSDILKYGRVQRGAIDAELVTWYAVSALYQFASRKRLAGFYRTKGKFGRKSGFAWWRKRRAHSIRATLGGGVSGWRYYRHKWQACFKLCRLLHAARRQAPGRNSQSAYCAGQKNIRNQTIRTERIVKPFEIVSDYKPSGDQPQAIERLVQGLTQGINIKP